jgi:hypothetical protein
MPTSLLSGFLRRYLLFVKAREEVCGAGGTKSHPPTLILVYPVITLSSFRITTLLISSTASRDILGNVTVSPTHNTVLKRSREAVMYRDSSVLMSHVMVTIKYTHV